MTKKLLWIALPLCAVGCAEAHLSTGFGVANRQAYSAQVVDKNAGDKPVRETGLDPQEAAIVLETYRRSLSPAKTDDAASKAPVLLLRPNAPGAPPPPEGMR